MAIAHSQTRIDARCDGRVKRLPTHGRERWRMLAEASVIFDDADEVDEVLAALLRVAVPRFADLCVVRLEMNEETTNGSILGDARDSTLLTDSALACALSEWDDGHKREARPLDPTTGISVPITVRGNRYGSVVFATVRASRRRYCNADVATASELVHRASSAIARARRQSLLEREISSLRDAACNTRPDTLRLPRAS
jgi:hypothetical protein